MPTPRGVRVLVVAHDPSVVSLVSAHLEYAGFDVHSANSGDGALTLLREHPGTVDVLLTDLVMPGMGGIELRGKVRGIAPEVKVVLMSGLADVVIWYAADVVNAFSPAAMIAAVENAAAPPKRARSELRRSVRHGANAA